MTRDQIESRMRELAAELSVLREAEEQRAAALAQAWLTLEAIDREVKTGTGRGRLDLAIGAWRKAEAEYRPAAAALEANLREAGNLRRQLESGSGRP